MSALVSMETFFFPGWPTAETPSAFFQFMLCLGAPLLIGATIIGLGLGLGRRRQYADDQRAAGLAEAPVAERRAVEPHRPQRALPTTEVADQVVVEHRSGGAHAAH